MVAFYDKAGACPAFFLRQQRCAVDADVPVRHRLQPFLCPVVAVFSDGGHVARVVDAEDVVHRDVHGHHQHQLVAFLTGCGEQAVAIIPP